MTTRRRTIEEMRKVLLERQLGRRQSARIRALSVQPFYEGRRSRATVIVVNTKSPRAIRGATRHVAAGGDP